MIKRLLILTFVLAVGGSLSAAPASAQNACLLQGTYVFNLTVIPGPASGIGTFVFTPPAGAVNCIGGVPGSVSMSSTLFSGELTLAYFVVGNLVTIPVGGGIALQGFLGQLEGGIARGFVYHSLGGDGIVVSGTAMHTVNSNLQAALDTEIAERKAADSALQALVSQGKAFLTSKFQADLVNGAKATVATLGPLPAGSYVVIVKASVGNLETDAAWACTLVAPDGSLDDTQTITKSTLNVIVNLGVKTLTAPGSFQLTCESGKAGSSVFEIVMAAIRVADVEER